MHLNVLFIVSLDGGPVMMSTRGKRKATIKTYIIRQEGFKSWGWYEREVVRTNAQMSEHNLIIWIRLAVVHFRVQGVIARMQRGSASITRASPTFTCMLINGRLS